MFMASKSNADFATLLKVPSKISVEKQIAVTKARLILLGFGDTCSRCSGTGHYSFNPGNGTTCFNCNGAKKLPPKLTDKLFRMAEEKVLDGTLDLVLKAASARVERKRKIKSASDTFMSAWQAVGLKYDWLLASQNVEPHHHYSNAYNKPISDAFDKLQAALNVAEKCISQISHAATPEAAKEAEEKAEQAASEALDVLGSGLMLIEKLKCEYEREKTQ
jgi:hypothetical protein